MHTVAANLRTIAELWPSLRDALTTPPVQTWPPASLADYLSQLAAVERDALEAETRAERAERTAIAMGERPVPLRLGILDTITVVEVKLLHAADVIAAEVQRPVIGMPTDLEGWRPADIARRQAAIADDRDDPRRWHWNMAAARDGLSAVRWLHGRADGAPGPFAALTEASRALLRTTAAEARQLVEKALGLDERADTAERPCPHCGGAIVLHQADTPTAYCGGVCGGVWRGPELAGLYADMQRRQAA